MPLTMLAGSAGQGAVYRVCSIRQGTVVAFPILTVMTAVASINTPVRGRPVEADRALNDVVPEMVLTVDGVAVRGLARQRAFGRECKPLDMRTESGGPCLAFDGYWAVLKPFAPGKHTIRFQAHYNSDTHPLGHLRQDVRYDITVK